MHGQIGKTDDEHGALGRGSKARQCDDRQRQADQGTQWKQRPRDVTETRRTQETREPDEAPEREQCQGSVERGVNDGRHGRCYADLLWIIMLCACKMLLISIGCDQYVYEDR